MKELVIAHYTPIPEDETSVTALGERKPGKIRHGRNNSVRSMWNPTISFCGTITASSFN
jgi:hypothetical protein